MQPCYLNFIICRFELLCQTAITWDSICTPSATEQIYCLKTHTRLDMCDANVQKHQFSNIPAY